MPRRASRHNAAHSRQRFTHAGPARFDYGNALALALGRLAIFARSMSAKSVGNRHNHFPLRSADGNRAGFADILVMVADGVFQIGEHWGRLKKVDLLRICYFSIFGDGFGDGRSTSEKHILAFSDDLW